MGFVRKLAIVYAVLAIMGVLAFVWKKKAVGIAVICLMIAGAFLLGYLWTISPM